VPTVLVRHQGGFLLANLGIFDPNSTVPTGVRRVAADGSISLVAGGLTGVTGVAVHDGRIYALEAFTSFLAPSTGAVVRLNNRTNAWENVVTRLSFPTAMTFDEDGNLFISNKGFGQPSNTSGEILKVALSRLDD
jgi:hypothetical protein